MDEHFDGEGEWRKGPWTPQEDKLLVDHISLHGEGKWNSVSKQTGLRRCGKSCRLRWVNYLRPDLKRGNITAEEETLIQELHAFWGNRWSTIARSLPGRTDNEIKNYWRTHFKTSKPPPSKSIEKARARFLIRQRRRRRRPGKNEEEEEQQQRRAAEGAAAAEKEEGERVLEAILAEQALLAEEMMTACVYSAAAPGLVLAADYDWSDEGESWGSLWNLDDVSDGCGSSERC